MAAVPTTPPAPGVATFNTEALTSNFANMAGTNVAVLDPSSSYSRSAYSQNAGGGTVNVPGLKDASGSKEVTGWAGLSDGVHYAIYAGAAALALMLLALTIWLCVRKSRKRKQDNARSNARMTSRSSFASPMHLRDGGHDSVSADSFKQVHHGVMRTDTNHSSGSLEKPRFGLHADAQSVRSIPPAYTNHGNHSNVSLLSTLSQGSTVVHQQISKVNIGLSSFKPVPMDGLSSFKASDGVVKETAEDGSLQDPPKSETVSPKKKPSPLPQDSYPPPRQAQRLYQEPRTPSSGRPQQQQVFNQQQRSPPQAHRPRPSPNHQQNAQHAQYNAQYVHQARQQQVPSSPAYSASSVGSNPAASGANPGYFGYNQHYDDRGPVSPVSPPTRAPSAGGHRYRMPPQNRAQAQYQNQPLSPSGDGGYDGHNYVPSGGQPGGVDASYRNPYSAFADDDGMRMSPSAAPHSGYGYQQQQQQQQERSRGPAGSYGQQNYGPAPGQDYGNYRQY